jgi:hypothetical protein
VVTLDHALHGDAVGPDRNFLRAAELDDTLAPPVLAQRADRLFS